MGILDWFEPNKYERQEQPPPDPFQRTNALDDPDSEINRWYANAQASRGQMPPGSRHFTTAVGPMNISAMETPEEGRAANVGLKQQVGPVQLGGSVDLTPRRGGGITAVPNAEAMINMGPVNVGGGATLQPWTSNPAQAGILGQAIKMYAMANVDMDIDDRLKIVAAGRLGPDAQKQILAELQYRLGDQAGTNFSAGIRHRDRGDGRPPDTTLQVGGGWRFR